MTHFAGHKGPDWKPVKQENKKAAPLKRTAIKKKFKATGEGEIFKEIWDERPHVCTWCKVHLGNEMRTWFFAHIKSKKQFPELRLDKVNIMLHCLECHTEYDQGTKASYAKRFKP